jgi:hypothetical protein
MHPETYQQMVGWTGKGLEYCHNMEQMTSSKERSIFSHWFHKLCVDCVVVVKP